MQVYRECATVYKEVVTLCYEKVQLIVKLLARYIEVCNEVVYESVISYTAANNFYRPVINNHLPLDVSNLLLKIVRSS
jgi:hypothetical protein